jgi:hypothetical protein
MATPGNFGGGSTGPDQIFLGITGAPPSAHRRATSKRGRCAGARAPPSTDEAPAATWRYVHRRWATPVDAALVALVVPGGALWALVAVALCRWSLLAGAGR